MSTHAGEPELQITSYMNLEQAMAEVRAYLEAKKSAAALPLDNTGAGANQFVLQQALLDRMGDIATRLGYVEPNSKLGAPGVFLKRALRKLIGWYSRPSHEFDRTALESLRQIRQDMLQQQQQILALQRQLSERELVPNNTQVQDSTELLRVTVSLFRSMLAAPAVQQALREEKPELLQRVQQLLQKVDGEFSGAPRVSGSAPAADQ